MIELILGGARSGKSRFAEQQALFSSLKLIYIATAQKLDTEMSDRIHIHQQRRGKQWHTIEEPYALADAMQINAGSENCLLVDCLTLWLSNLLHSENSKDWKTEKSKLLELLPELPGHIIMVSNEVGSGIVPMGDLSRNYVDEIGWLHQELAQLSDRVTLVIAGLPQRLK